MGGLGGREGVLDSPSHLLYEPRFLAGSRPSNREWCIYGVSFTVATCTLFFPQYGVLG